MRTSEYAQLVPQGKILEAVLRRIKRARLQFVAQNLSNAEQNAVPMQRPEGYRVVRVPKARPQSGRAESNVRGRFVTAVGAML
jgi:hypothetical protein